MFEIPVVLFVFRRLESVKMIFDVYKEVKPKTLYVFADGARTNKEGELEKVNEVRKYITDNVNWECDFHPIFHENNIGYAKNIRDGISKALTEQGKAIIMEDDAVPMKEFFYYCEQMLTVYENDKRVNYIAGFNAVGDIDKKDGYLYTFGKTTPMSGAIATWADRWKECDFDIKNWPENRKSKRFKKYFNNNEVYKVFANGFDDTFKRPEGEWDVQFQHDLLDRERVAITPVGNLAKSYGYLEASHEQGDIVSKNLAKHMDFTSIKFSIPLKLHENVKWDKEYDVKRQNVILEVHGNYLQRRIEYIYLFIKNIVYKILPKSIWNGIKKIVKK